MLITSTTHINQSPFFSIMSGGELNYHSKRFGVNQQTINITRIPNCEDPPICPHRRNKREWIKPPRTERLNEIAINHRAFGFLQANGNTLAFFNFSLSALCLAAEFRPLTFQQRTFQSLVEELPIKNQRDRPKLNCKHYS